MLELTDEAVDTIKAMVAAEGAGEGGGLRIAADTTEEEVGLELSVEDAPTEGDEVVDRDGARVFLDAVAAEVLGEKQLSVHAHGDHYHFEILDREG
jgi:Fe-S cluster assembly iron-binding protein IscA